MSCIEQVKDKVISLTLLHDAMHSADCAVTRCPSIFLSITRLYSIETVKHIITLFLFRFSLPNGMAILQQGLP